MKLVTAPDVCYLEPRKQKGREVVLVGRVWNLDPSTWHDQNILIPQGTLNGTIQTILKQ